jgi:oxalate decarboxylase/phosphoglucose isomerase-like protein (cupin superfamily)
MFSALSFTTDIDDESKGRNKSFIRKTQGFPCYLYGVIIFTCIILFVFLTQDNKSYGIHQFVMNLRTQHVSSNQASAGFVGNEIESTIKNEYQSTMREYFHDHIQKIIQEIRPPLQPYPPSDGVLPYRSLLSVVSDWNPDEPDIPPTFREVLQHFDYGNPEERQMAERYRNAEIPFKLFNVTEFHDISLLWTDDYLSHNLEDIRHKAHIERSKNNHFMFWSSRGGHISNFKPPTEIMSKMNFDMWLQLARQADTEKWTNTTPHYYFMAGAEPHEHGRTFISRDLKLFSTEKANFFITKIGRNKGIQCRFGMRGVIAESHYDSGRNMIAVLKGAKRYILNPPESCDKLGIISDTRHPSYRHSVIDWSDIDQATHHQFDLVHAIDTVIHAGEVLYIPSFWFHYIISLQYSIQCNSRSGFPDDMKGEAAIKQCFRKGRV